MNLNSASRLDDPFYRASVIRNDRTHPHRDPITTGRRTMSTLIRSLIHRTTV